MSCNYDIQTMSLNKYINNPIIFKHEKKIYFENIKGKADQLNSLFLVLTIHRWIFS